MESAAPDLTLLTEAHRLPHFVALAEDGHYGRVEDAQMNILHMICYAVCELGA